MTTLIKNCGLKTPEAVACSVISGASFLGFVHYPASPRHLSSQDIWALMGHVPNEIAKVIVLVDPDDHLLAELPRPDFWQVHNVTDPKRIKAIHTLTGVPVITAVRVRSAGDIHGAEALEKVSAHLLFDAAEPGSGHVFNWELIEDLELEKPWFLAGGLTAANVAQAIRTTHAPMVDVSSGIEAAPGMKSLEKIAAFNAAVLHASDA